MCQIKVRLFGKKNSFTLSEIIVASLIVASVFVGLMSSVVSVRKLNLRSLRRLQATLLGIELLEGLYDDVRQDTWLNTTSPLAPGFHNVGIVTIDGISYLRNYTVLSGNFTTTCRRVTLNVTW